ncbi:BamA/TamA family outer membrane protein [Flaviaesturariibacter amylovorans]|uniref:Metallophosphoesterase n=1 Tax=Flaviaesturariibacter amylovorans TaxID=1084520 RepID=A0ABP8G4F2_9BACT
MKRILFSWALLLAGLLATAQTDSLRHRIFLLGDAGELVNGKHPAVDWLKQHVDWNDTRNMAVWLGDNIYPLGLPTEGEPDFEEAKQVIDYLISLNRGKKAKAYFIPGNHDWMNGKIGGWLRVQNQVDYINSQQLSNVEAWPRGGCPGPITIEVDSQLVVVLTDTQWFLHIHDKPGPASNCSAKSLDDFATELEEIIETHPNQLVVVATHHPIYSQGVHGGAYTLRQHFFPLAEAIPGLYIPLPVLGSVYPIARGVFGNVQDFNHPTYRAMAKAIEDVLKRHPNTIAVAGHDHSSQLLKKEKDSLYYIVSGNVAELTRVKKANNNLLFSDLNYGFGIIEITKSGKVTARFYNTRSPNLQNALFSKDLFTIKKAAPALVDTVFKPYPKTVSVAANKNLREGGLRRFFSGRNYRQEWTTPVAAPVLDLSTEQGGLKPVRLGGGKQTRSLRLEDKEGREWALRSIEKFPDAALPPDLRQTLARDVVAQGISASYPYAGLAYLPLARAVGLPEIRRKLVFVPSDPRLGRFRAGFSDVLAILEEREPVNVKKTYNTDDVVFRLFDDNDEHIDQQVVLRARLLDNFIMDFDRHEDQWRWATRDTGKGKIYYPIARDHDQAFFKNEGIVPWFAKKPWFLPEVQGFRAKAENIRTFNRVARNFDRFFMTDLSAPEWERAIDTFLSAMTDSVIERALATQPLEVHNARKNEIVETLKQRRQYFRDDMMEYYRFLSHHVDVVGSNQREEFRVTKNADKTVRVTVHKIDKQNRLATPMYDRTFEPKVTDEIRLYGLNDDDRFIIEGERSPIKVRIIGGSGKDSFVNTASGGALRIYDATFEQNYLSGISDGHNRLSRDPNVNRYNRLGFKYNYNRPGVSVAYNMDDGFFIGTSFEMMRQGFRKEPFRARHYFLGQHALRTSSFRFRYEGDFTQALGHKDLIVRADIRAPVNVTNFFGFGNNTPYNRQKAIDRYYRIRYDIADLSVLARRQLQSWMRISYGLTFQYFRVKEEQNKLHFIDEPNIPGVDYSDLYKEKYFVGPHFRLDINSQNNRIIPTRGLAMDFNVRPLIGLSQHAHNVVRADLDMRLFSSLFELPRFVLGTRFGWGKVFGDDIEIPQAYYLSGINNLRGYRRDRFAGQSVLYLQNELRFQLANFRTYLFPGAIGLLGFFDVGQVKYGDVKPRGWYAGYGGGIWVAPVKRFVLTGMMAFSQEEKKGMPLLTFGFPF